MDRMFLRDLGDKLVNAVEILAIDNNEKRCSKQVKNHNYLPKLNITSFIHLSLLSYLLSQKINKFKYNFVLDNNIVLIYN